MNDTGDLAGAASRFGALGGAAGPGSLSGFKLSSGGGPNTTKRDKRSRNELRLVFLPSSSPLTTTRCTSTCVSPAGHASA